MTNKPNPTSPETEPLLPGDPLELTEAALDKEAEITRADIERALAKGRRLPFMRAMIDAKPTKEGRE